MTGWGCSSRVAATCAALAVIALSTAARAQESNVPPQAPAQFGDVLELQFGGGYLFREGDLASLPSVEVGVVLWWNESWGFSLPALKDYRRAHGVVRLRRRHANRGPRLSSLDRDATVASRKSMA